LSSVERAAQSRPSRAADHRLLFWLALLLTGPVVALIPAAARAQSFSPNDPALDEYVESLPVPEGSRDPSHPARPRKLPRSISRGLARVPVGHLLEHVASSPALGAPSTVASAPSSGHSRRRARGRTARTAKSSAAPAPTAATDFGALPHGSLASAATKTASGGSLLLLLLLAAATAVAVLLRVLLPALRARKGGGK
jgi:hypothetical protein